MADGNVKVLWWQRNHMAATQCRKLNLGRHHFRQLLKTDDLNIFFGLLLFFHTEWEQPEG